MATKPNDEAITPAKPAAPRLGDVIKVKPAAGLNVREDDSGYFAADKASSVTVTTRIIRLLNDGDLIAV